MNPTKLSVQDRYRLGCRDGWNGIRVRSGMGFDMSYLCGHEDGKTWHQEERQLVALGADPKGFEWHARELI